MVKQNAKREINEEQKQYILDHYMDMEYAQIANNIGIPRYTVVYFLKKQGLEGTKKVISLTEEQQKELVEKYPTRTGQEWAEYYGLSLSNFRHAARKLGLAGTIKDPGIRFTFSEEDDTYILENHLTSTQEELAEHIGCNRQHIRRRIDTLGLTGYHRWDEEKEKYLEDNWVSKTDAEIASETGRTVHAIVAKRIQMGLMRDNDLSSTSDGHLTGTGNSRKKVITERSKYRWKEDETQFIKDHSSKMSDDEMALALDRSYRAVKHKRLQLNIHREHYRSSHEVEIENFLIENNIPYQIQFPIGRYKYDFRINNTLIEYQGDYYHCNPKFYPNGPTYTYQSYVVEKDKHKKLLAIEHGFQVLEIWENDFIFNKNEVLNKLKAVYEGNFVDNERAKSVEA